MDFICSLIAVIAIALCSSPTKGSIAIYIIPSKINVSSGESVKISCKINGFFPKIIDWRLNGTRIKEIQGIDEKYYDISTSLSPPSSNLTLQTIMNTQPILDNSTVTCEGIHITTERNYSIITSMEAVLRVQGPLSAAMNLTAYFIDGTLLSQWIHPYTLPGVDIVWYLIELTLINSDADGLFTSDGLAQPNPTTTAFDQCPQYQICVSAVTAAGVGDEACILSNRSAGVLESLTDHMIEVKVLRHGNETLLEQSYVTMCLDDLPVENQSILKDAMHSVFDMSSRSSIQPVIHGQVNHTYNLSFDFATKGDDSNILFVNISLQELTNHVEDIIITNSGTGTTFECVFAQYSSTEECFVTISCESEDQESNGIPCELHLQKGTSSLIPNCTLDCSTFTISAFDVIQNSTSDASSVSKHNVTLNFMSVTPTPATTVKDGTAMSMNPTSSTTTSSTISNGTVNEIIVGTVVALGFFLAVAVVVAVRCYYFIRKKKHPSLFNRSNRRSREQSTQENNPTNDISAVTSSV